MNSIVNKEFENSFARTKWKQDNKFVKEYLKDSDIYIPYRKEVLRLFQQLYTHFCQNKVSHPHVIDLGCGDGIIIQALISIDPTIKATLVDGSKVMLDQAVANIPNCNLKSRIESSFQSLFSSHAIEEADVIVSSLAIHHLEENEKEKLYENIFSKLKKGGMFLNFDAVLSTSTKIEEFDLHLWKDWIVYNQATTLEHIPSQYKNNSDNIPSRIDVQLEMLKRCGFTDVTIFYKYGLFTLFGGIK